MKKIVTFLCVALAAVVLVLPTKNVGYRAVADTEARPFTVNFSDEDLGSKLNAAFVQKLYGDGEELKAHWSVQGGVLSRINDLDGEDVTGNYAVAYFSDCYFRYFELTTKVAYGDNGLTGIVFGKNDIKLRHLADGNAVYFMPGPYVELCGSTITKKETSVMLEERTGFYELKVIVCEDYVKVLVDGKERINKAIPSELLRYGKIGLFTANTAGAFSDGVTIYNLDEHGNRIALEAYTATTGVKATNKTVEMKLSDEKLKYEYAVQPADATVKDVRFLSINPDIAIVDNEGYIRPLKAGVTEIEVITVDGGFKDSLLVTIDEVIPELEGVVLDKASGTIETVGGKLYLSVSYFPEEAENQGFKWSTSDSKVAIVNNGTVTAMGVGTCVITVKDYNGKFSATCTVTVKGTAAESSSLSSGCAGYIEAGPIALLFGAAAVVALMRRRQR